MRSFALTLVLLFASTASAWAAPQWFEVRSANFTVITDGGEKRGRELALRFEQLRLIFGQILSRAKVHSGVPVRILALRSGKQLRQVSPVYQGKAVELAGLYQAGEGVAFIALDLSAHNGLETVFHEYAHLLLNANVPSMPLWFDEGFAEFFSTIKVSGAEFEYGGVPEDSVRVLQSYRFLPMQELLSVERESKIYNVGDKRSLFYAQSWLAMHYLWFNPKKNKQTQQLLQSLDSRVPLAEAVRTAYGVDLKTLDRELEDYFRTGRAMIYRVKLPAGSDKVEMTSRPLPELDARACIAEMRLGTRDHFDAAVGDFQEILAAQPENAIAARGLGYAYLRKRDVEKAADYFRKAAALDSGDARVHYYSAVLMQSMGAERDPEMLQKMRASLQKAVALDPNLADAFGWLALTYVWEGDRAAAIAPMKRALELSPRNEQYAFNLAGFYMMDRQWDAAAELARRLRNSPEPHIASQAERMLESIALMKNPRSVPMVQWETEEEEAEPAPPAPANPEKQAPAKPGNFSSDVLRYFTGTLTKVECPAPRKAVFHIARDNRAFLLHAPDVRQVSVTGAAQFSCAWHDRKVKGFYRPDDTGKLTLVAIELEN